MHATTFALCRSFWPLLNRHTNASNILYVKFIVHKTNRNRFNVEIIVKRIVIRFVGCRCSLSAAHKSLIVSVSFCANVGQIENICGFTIT